MQTCVDTALGWLAETRAYERASSEAVFVVDVGDDDVDYFLRNRVHGGVRTVTSRELALTMEGRSKEQSDM